MTAEMGEYLVGAYLELFEGCEIISYNIRSRDKGIRGMGELDVVGLNLKRKTAFLCEVVTHLRGTMYAGGREETVRKIFNKYENQRKFAKKYLGNFSKIHFQLWSPSVSKIYVDSLGKKRGLELVINQDYSKCINKLRDVAKGSTKNTGIPPIECFKFLSIKKRCLELTGYAYEG